MRYSRLLWQHSSPTEPVEILSEYDAEGWERRKVEVFPDGALGYASSTESHGGTALALIPCPPDEEVVSEPEFRVLPLSKDEFERAWDRARRAPTKNGPSAEPG
jgi:hypothetical protein